MPLFGCQLSVYRSSFHVVVKWVLILFFFFSASKSKSLCELSLSAKCALNCGICSLCHCQAIIKNPHYGVLVAVTLLNAFLISRSPLPHCIRKETGEVCLFTRDEPSLTSEQTERFYKKLLSERGVQKVTEVIPFKVLKTEYKPYEAKLRLLGNFDIFLADSRIRRLLPSQIGKHFYERKKAPLSVDLQNKHLGPVLERLIQGTTLTLGKKGSCCMTQVAHSGMTTDEILENIIAASETISSKLKTKAKGKLIKIIHLKSQSSVALPIYNSTLSHLAMVEDLQSTQKKGKKRRKVDETQEKSGAASEDEEPIPQLLPIQTPSKKAKLEVSPKIKTEKKAAKPVSLQKGKRRKPRPGKVVHKAAKPRKAPAHKLKPKSS
ncbi:ribosomal L1 domain-containing protein 1-like isoform X2 [Denticeps clupeoides]|uniref:ribosomal L1 domain-containing protein 1-like isoform X2 n=1 Tax=Denticeps clupeoides TaxID=299321 RepID=UPI0010A46C7F|nr:ribosomal L1 domain-containing protein 1-like isoform X2 [Denticeps clupeoides]